MLNVIEEEAEEGLEALRRRYFWIHLTADFLAGLAFVVGSVFFFYDSLQYAGTWLFVIGSVLFAAKPAIRLVHEIHRARRCGSSHVTPRPAQG